MCERETFVKKRPWPVCYEKEKEELANLWLGSHLSQVLIASASYGILVDHQMFQRKFMGGLEDIST
jgi:hypothetical protein